MIDHKFTTKLVRSNKPSSLWRSPPTLESRGLNYAREIQMIEKRDGKNLVLSIACNLNTASKPSLSQYSNRAELI